MSDGKPLLSFSGRWPRLREWLLPGSAAAFVIAHCVGYSNRHLFWADELLTWYPVSAPFRTMLASTADTINATPPFYFILTWGWAHVFGNSELALRLLSAVALGAAILLMFSVLRRVYGALAATLAVAVALAFCDPSLLLQSTFARFHTLLVIEVALALLVYQRMMAWQDRVPFRLLAANCGIHGCIVMTHYFGPLYSGAVLAAILLTGAVNRFNPFRAALSLVAGWTVFLPWLPAFERHRAMARPTFWIEVPSVGHLRYFYGHYFANDYWPAIALGLGLSFVLGVTMALGGGGGIRRLIARVCCFRHRELPLLMLVPGFGLIPLLVYFLSTRPGGPSMFLDRYLFCSALGWAILCAHLSHRALMAGKLGRHFRLTKALTVAQTAGVAAAICWGGWDLLREGFSAAPKSEYEDILVGMPYYDKIVVEHVHEYLVHNFYSTWPQRYVYVVDEEVGLQERGGGLANHRIMAGLKRNFPASFAGVVANDKFLSATPGFWVKLDPAMRWWQLRIESNPQFISTPATGGLVHVERRTPAQ